MGTCHLSKEGKSQVSHLMREFEDTETHQKGLRKGSQCSRKIKGQRISEHEGLGKYVPLVRWWRVAGKVA